VRFRSVSAHHGGSTDKPRRRRRAVDADCQRTASERVHSEAIFYNQNEICRAITCCSATMDALLANKAREAVARREDLRRKATMVLVMRHLLDNGYIESYERLVAESNVSLTKVRLA
jgi:hypothetical protein